MDGNNRKYIYSDERVCEERRDDIYIYIDVCGLFDRTRPMQSSDNLDYQQFRAVSILIDFAPFYTVD